MREITVKLYQFDELSESAKEKAREWFRDDGGLMAQWAFDNVIEDAKNIGLDIHTLDDRRANEGEFTGGALDCAKAIRENHGKTCETFKTVSRYWKELNSNDETERENSEHEFLHDLLEDYRVMLNEQIEYDYSTEQVDESIRANEYEFTEEGKRA